MNNTKPPPHPEQPERACSTHPDAPHGFDRTASHSAGRYVCECEGWQPPAEPLNAEMLAALRQCVAALDALHAPGDSIYTRASDAADRAIARAAIARAEAQRKPLTDLEVDAEYDRLDQLDAEYERREVWFARGVRFAERAHGVTGDDQ